MGKEDGEGVKGARLYPALLRCAQSVPFCTGRGKRMRSCPNVQS